MTENKAAGAERRPLLETVDEDLAADDNDDGSEEEGGRQSDICYFLVGGNERGLFDVNPATHELTAMRPLDREEAASHRLLVWATEDCSSRQTPPPLLLNPDTNDSLLHVLVNVVDVNDNVPEFTQALFTGGVSTDVAFGTEFMRVEAIDRDEGPHAEIEYFVCGEMEVINAEGFGPSSRQPFLADPVSGGILLNFDPQPHQKGYFSFNVCARDRAGTTDAVAQAAVTVYLLREDQRVRFVMRSQPEEIRARAAEFSSMLANATGAIVNVDRFQVHTSDEDSSVVDTSKTDVLLHFVHPANNSVMEVADILRTLDYRTAELGPFFKEFDVLQTDGGGPAAGYTAVVSAAARSTTETMIMFWLVGGCVFLGLILCVVLVICLSQRTRYARKLKALATQAVETVQQGGSSSASNCGLANGTLGHRIDLVPNTNKHAGEGSNPIWLTGRGYEYEDDNNSWGAGGGAQAEPEVNFYTMEAALDSLDSNVLNPRTEAKVNYSQSSLLGSRSSSSSPNLAVRTEQSCESRTKETVAPRGGDGLTSRHSDSSGRGSCYEPTASFATTGQLTAVAAADKLGGGWRSGSAAMLFSSSSTGSVGRPGSSVLSAAASSSGRERLNHNNPLARI
jgi:hypothetical protein